jgi:hypothetical protein
MSLLRAGNPGANNSEVGAALGWDTRGQVSRLLNRLGDLGPLAGGRRARSHLTRWWATGEGRRVALAPAVETSVPAPSSPLGVGARAARVQGRRRDGRAGLIVRRGAWG